MRRTLRAAAAVAAVVALGVTGAAVGSASQLTVDGGDLSVGTVSHPCAGRTLAVTAAPVPSTTSTVRVTTPADWPATCVGRRIDLLVGDGAVVGSGTVPAAPAAGTTVDVALDASVTPGAAVVTVGAVVAGWSLGAAWSYTQLPPPTGPITPGNLTTALTILSWSSTSPNQLCANVRVSSTVPGQAWRLDINTWFSPWNGVTAGYYTNGNVGGSLLQPVAGVGHVQEASWSYPLGSQREFQICNASMPAPPAPATVVENAAGGTTMTLGGWARSTTSGALCVPVTVASQSGNRTWMVDVNVAAAPFNGTTPTFGGTHGQHVLTAPAPGRAGWLRLTGASPYDVVHHVHQPQVSFTVCAG